MAPIALEMIDSKEPSKTNIALISGRCIPRARNIPIELFLSSANITKILMTKRTPATTVNEPNTKKKPATFSEADSDVSIIDLLIGENKKDQILNNENINNYKIILFAWPFIQFFLLFEVLKTL